MVGDNPEHSPSPAGGSMFSAVSLLVHHFKYLAEDVVSLQMYRLDSIW